MTTTELATFSRPAMIGTLAEVGLVLSETKTLLAKLQASMLCGQVAEHAAHHRVCPECGVLQGSVKNLGRYAASKQSSSRRNAPGF